MSVKVNCCVCGKEELIIPSRVSKYKTCSKTCLGVLFKAKDDLICDECGKPFHKKDSHKTPKNFCCISCLAIWKTKNQYGSNNPNFRNKQYDTDGTRLIHSDKFGRMKLHHAVVFEILGLEKLPAGYVTHHRDCDHQNNVAENLVLLTPSDHRWIHKQYGNATLFAHYYNKISTETLVSWSNDQERAKKILDLTCSQQKEQFTKITKEGN